METSQRPTKSTLPEPIGAHSTTDQVLKYLVTELKLELVDDMARLTDPSPAQLAGFWGAAGMLLNLDDKLKETSRKLTMRRNRNDGVQ